MRQGRRGLELNGLWNDSGAGGGNEDFEGHISDTAVQKNVHVSFQFILLTLVSVSVMKFLCIRYL